MRFILAVLLAVFFASFVYSQWVLFQINRELKPAGKFHRVKGIKIHYIDKGSGIPVVLLHGASSNALDVMQPLGETLAQNYRVIAVDRPGHGHSERPAQSLSDSGWTNPLEQADIVLQLLTDLGIEKAIFIGHSWAGSVVMMILSERPERALGGVLLAGAVHSWDTGVDFSTVKLPGYPIVGPILLHSVYPLFGSLVINGAIKKIFLPDQPPSGYIEESQIKLIFQPRAFRSNAQDMRLLSNYLAEKFPSFHNIKTPLLMITAKDDTIVPSWNHSDRLVKEVSGSRIEYLEHAGHALHKMNVKEIVSFMDDWSAQTLNLKK